MACIYCARGFHGECRSRKGCKKCHPKAKSLAVEMGLAPAQTESKEKRPVGRPPKEPHEMTDEESSGRKRAAYLYPIYKEEPCEWLGQKNCGGGTYPIVGCREGKQTHRHHGPIKRTTHNEAGNVHRICVFCHNRWHAMNDPEYDEDIYKNIPHNPEPTTEMELIANEAWWKASDEARALLKEAKAKGISH